MKLAIIGAGLVAKTFHIPAFLRCKDVQITAVCDVYEPAASAMAEPLGAAVYTDFQEMLHCADVDTVTICTRTDTHCQMAVEAARAGKNIFLEKPMALNVAQAAQIVEAVEENDVIFMLGMLNRFRTESRLLTERRLSGQMGEIYHADARWMRRRGVPANAWVSQKALEEPVWILAFTRLIRHGTSWGARSRSPSAASPTTAWAGPPAGVPSSGAPRPPPTHPWTPRKRQRH